MWDVMTGKKYFVLGQFITTVVRHQPFGVDQIKRLEHILHVNPVESSGELGNVTRHPNRRGAGTKDNNLVLQRCHPGQLHRVEKASRDDRACALNVIIEAAILVLIPL